MHEETGTVDGASSRVGVLHSTISIVISQLEGRLERKIHINIVRTRIYRRHSRGMWLAPERRTGREGRTSCLLTVLSIYMALDVERFRSPSSMLEARCLLRKVIRHEILRNGGPRGLFVAAVS